MLGRQGAEEHSEQRASEHAREHDQGDFSRTDERSLPVSRRVFAVSVEDGPSSCHALGVPSRCRTADSNVSASEPSDGRPYCVQGKRAEKGGIRPSWSVYNTTNWASQAVKWSKGLTETKNVSKNVRGTHEKPERIGKPPKGWGGELSSKIKERSEREV